MRIAITGQHGQTVRALRELAGPKITVLPVGRPDLDLEKPKTILPALRALSPDLIINAAAYTAVDRAEKDRHSASSVNWLGAEAVAEAAYQLNLPLIQLSTDYVFDGKKESPYTEEDPASPLSVYGKTKFLGEKVVEKETDNFVILRTSWLYAPYGNNFVRTMLRLAREKEEIRIVADALGNPTYAPDLALALIKIARALLKSPSDANLRGVFHFAGRGETSWAGFAREIFTLLAAQGRKTPVVIPISSADYPTPAARPLNSRLDCGKLTRIYGVTAPPRAHSLDRALARLTLNEND